MSTCSTCHFYVFYGEVHSTYHTMPETRYCKYHNEKTVAERGCDNYVPRGTELDHVFQIQNEWVRKKHEKKAET